MSEEESGGVQGLRAWAADAAERVRRLMPALRGGAPPPGDYAASVAELDQLAGLLDHDVTLGASVRVWLAGALTLRFYSVGGAPADRERAERLLREARDRSTPLGSAVSEEDRRWAAMFLLTNLWGIESQPDTPGAVPDGSAFFERAMRSGPTGITSMALEAGPLLDEAVQLPLPPEFLGRMRQFQRLLGATSGSDLVTLLTEIDPSLAHSPVTHLLRQMHPGPAPRGEPAPGREPREQDRERREQPEQREQSAEKPTRTLDDFRNFFAVQDAVNAATTGLNEVTESGDPQALNNLLGRLRSVQDLPLPGLDTTLVLESVRGLLLNVSHAAGGNLQDQSAGYAHLDRIVEGLELVARTVPTQAVDPTVMGQVLALYGRVMEARQREDVPALRELVAEAEAFGEAVPEDEPLRFMVDLSHFAALAGLGAVTGEQETLLRSLGPLEKGLAGAQESDLPGAEGASSWMPHLDLMRAVLTGEPGAIPDHVPPPPDASAERLYQSTLDLRLRLAQDEDPAVLATFIEESERLRDRVRQGRAPRIAAQALWSLAEAYQLRRIGNEDPEDTAFLEAARESLAVLAADVLLQTGAEHGLLTARTGASRVVQVARWATALGKVHEAVSVLELGRALVLHAASTSAAVPELLRAAGHPDLAEEWAAAGASPGGGDGEPGEVPAALPSTLRRRALDALGYRREGALLTTPTLAELSDGVAEAGADALIYLLPGEGAEQGVVITVAPELGVGTGVLPLLSGPESGPLERYLDAAASRTERPEDPAAEQAWEDALTQLCGWAHRTLSPLLNQVEERLAAAGERDEEPLRVVLVPCGRLGIVPWHAAYSPVEGGQDHLCKSAVISYAASGGEFLRTVRRAPREPGTAPVLLADPTMTMTHAELEVLALRRSCYPGARLCGELYEVPPEEMTPGTPDDVLDLLADGASLLHVASHGSAGPSPTVSALYLAPDERGGPGTLTVSRLLDGERHPDAPDGPLVVLSACETDLSTRDHDEALTLTTAFLSRGARDVVGSRWAVRDSASALLMAVFHHFLTVDGLSPVDALRAAQLWMLDPHRENPGTLHGELLRTMRRPGLERIALWAGFIHQGHPGRAEDRTEGRAHDRDDREERAT